MSTALPDRPTIVYPDSDGQPMSDNTLQFRWIVTIQGGLDGIFRNDPAVFVAGDLLWYPVEGEPTIRAAPDVLVASGRPKGYRGSYKQWEEEGIAPQVVFEVQSPGNRFDDMLRKFQFYERYGVEEYYLYDPEKNVLSGWVRAGSRFRDIPSTNGWTSPRLGIRFVLTEDDLHIFGPDGQKFATYLKLIEQRERERQEKERERQEKERERQEKERERQEKEGAQRRAEKLAAQLRALGVEPEA